MLVRSSSTVTNGTVNPAVIWVIMTNGFSLVNDGASDIVMKSVHMSGKVRIITRKIAHFARWGNRSRRWN
jgi:hypothetical protein